MQDNQRDQNAAHRKLAEANHDYIALYMKYIGVLSLLGKVSHHFSRLDQIPVETAFKEANKILKARKASIKFEKDHRGGWSAFDVQSEEEKK